MKCEHCGYDNSEYAITCDKCGKPLNIEKNLVLQKKYNHKPMAIDIEKITPDYEVITFNKTKQQVKYTISFLLGVLFISIILLIIYLIRNNDSKDIINKLNKQINTNEVVLVYIGKDSDINKTIEDYSKKYKFTYVYVPQKKLTIRKKNKLMKKYNIESLSNTLLYIKNGKKINHKNIDNSEEQLLDYLKDNNIIAKVDGNPDEIKKNYETAFNSQESIVMYIANNQNTTNKEHNSNLENLCSDYDINYVFIEGYKLSDIQKLRLLKKLNYNEIHNELLVILDEGKIKNVSEYVADNKKDYFELISSYGIIDITSAEKLKNITLNQVGKVIKKNEKNIILITSDDCIYCDRLKPILGKISIQNNITIYNYKYNKKEREKLEKFIIKRGFKSEKITTPLVLISENNKINDYVIGLSSKSFYEEKFKEYGIIR